MISTFLLQILWILAVATALACWCGWGLARLALPLALRPYRRELTPLLGYTLVLVAGYWAVWTVIGLNLALPIILAATAALNLLAWRRTGPPGLGGIRPEQLALVALLIVTLVIGIAPLLHYGHPAVIGDGWDIESALPTVRYLEHGPVSAIAAAPPNPLRDLVRDPPRIGKTLGFAVWQGSVDLLTRIEALLTFVPLLAWLRALGILAIYVLFRATFGMRAWPALLAAAWTSAGALMLWITFFNFEKQLSAWPLIPLGLLIGVAAVEDAAVRGRRAWPVVLLAAIVLTSLPVAYYPALTLWGPMAVGVGLAILVQSRRRLRLIGSAVAVIGASVLLAFPTIIDYQHGFLYRYNEQLTTLGLFRYIPATDIVGLTPFLGVQAQPATPVWALPALLALIALIVVGVTLGECRVRWLGLVASGLVYLAWLRWSQAYPYAYMKGAAYAGFIFLGAAAAGWQALTIRIPRRIALPAAVVPLLLLGLIGLGQQQVVAAHWEHPGLYGDELPALLALREIVPAGSTVALTSDPRVQGVKSGLAAYLLDRAIVWGRVQTGYYASNAGTPDALGEYGLLQADEDPTLRGYHDLVWRGGSFALYRRADDVHAQLRPERTLAPGERLSLSVGDERLIVGQEQAAGGSPRRVAINLSSLQDSQLSVNGKPLTIPAGSALVRTASLQTPSALELINTGTAPLTLRYLTLTDAHGSEAAEVEPIKAALVARVEAEAHDQTVTTMFDALLPDSGPVVLSLDIWDTPRGVHYGWYGLPLQTNPGVQGITATLDIKSGTMRAVAGNGAEIPLGVQFGGLQKGDYVAQLQASAGHVPLTAPEGIFAFSIGDDGAISGVRSEGATMLSTTTDRPPQPLDVQVGDDVRLIGYDLNAATVRSGNTIDLTLWWQARSAPGDERSVLLQLLDASGAKIAQGDGPPASGARPTSQWFAGEVVIDMRQIKLPDDLPVGNYTLAAGMYRWPSLERLPLSQAGTRQLDDVLRIPITVMR